MTSKNHYQLFGLSEAASPAEIDAAYQKVRALYQRQGVKDPAKLQALDEAYTVLREPLRRRIYDASLSQSSGMEVEPEPESAVNLGARWRWLAVASALLLIAGGTVWWVKQRPSKLDPVDATVLIERQAAAKPAAVEPVPAEPSQNNIHYGTWQKKYAELVDVKQARDDRERRLYEFKTRQQNRRDEKPSDADRLEDERYERMLSHELEWLKDRAEMIEKVELKAATSGLLMPKLSYQAPPS